jgi:hypothetical protein
MFCILSSSLSVSCSVCKPSRTKFLIPWCSYHCQSQICINISKGSNIDILHSRENSPKKLKSLTEKLVFVRPLFFHTWLSIHCFLAENQTGSSTLILLGYPSYDSNLGLYDFLSSRNWKSPSKSLVSKILNSFKDSGRCVPRALTFKVMALTVYVHVCISCGYQNEQQFFSKSAFFGLSL